MLGIILIITVNLISHHDELRSPSMSPPIEAMMLVNKFGLGTLSHWQVL